MSDPIRYTVPYYLLGRELTGPIANGSRANVLDVYRGFVQRMQPAPVYHGLENLPVSPRFILAANHYQRKGLWIAHAASAVAMALSARYACNPPIRWIVTANWPRWKVGGRTIPSPGDVILPKVAHALWCYAVPFAGTNPQATAASLKRLVTEARNLDGPVGVFPEGATATAGHLLPALPGVGRFIKLMARQGWPVMPAGIMAQEGGFVVRFGPAIPADVLCDASDAGQTVMDSIHTVLSNQEHK